MDGGEVCGGEEEESGKRCPATRGSVEGWKESGEEGEEEEGEGKRRPSQNGKRNQAAQYDPREEGKRKPHQRELCG